MLLRSVVVVLTGLLTLMGSTDAVAAPAATGTTTFAVVEGVTAALPGYSAHISGVGLNGPWQGWHFAADIAQTSDCDAGDCPIVAFAWELYDKTGGSSKEWGGASTDSNGEGPRIMTLSGATYIPLAVTGGIPFTQGTGNLTGNLPPGSYYGIATGDLALTLDMH